MNLGYPIHEAVDARRLYPDLLEKVLKYEECFNKVCHHPCSHYHDHHHHVSQQQQQRIDI